MEMTIENAVYIKDIVDGVVSDDNIAITATVDGVEMNIPVSEGNRHYKEILRQVEEGTLTIADADAVGEE